MLWPAWRRAHCSLARLCLTVSGSFFKGLLARRRPRFSRLGTVRWLARAPWSLSHRYRNTGAFWNRCRLASRVKHRSSRRVVIRGRPDRGRSLTPSGFALYLARIPRTVLGGISRIRPMAAAFIPASAIPTTRHMVSQNTHPGVNCINGFPHVFHKIR